MACLGHAGRTSSSAGVAPTNEVVVVIGDGVFAEEIDFLTGRKPTDLFCDSLDFKLKRFFGDQVTLLFEASNRAILAFWSLLLLSERIEAATQFIVASNCNAVVVL